MKIKDRKSLIKSDSLIENKIGGNLQSKHESLDSFLSPEKAAMYLDVSRKFIYELIARGEIKAATVGGRLRRIRLSDLETWLASSN